ncbi:MAG: bifunctional diaminohydroxyphosphoribosylaminopyrimidine deaminase/5-amino-6-(5-phosphoribosylamino)uracil reductase RibD [bacterium]
MDPKSCMLRGLELAARGRGHTATNPLVGAVIVKDDRIIAEGYHHFYGGDHAEVDALKNAATEVHGATMFATLEPCSHFGKTPPCARALIDAGLRKVYVAMVDPNPKVAGQGIAMLRNAGIEVEIGLCEAEARELNRPYLKYIETGLPYVTIKIAQTLDGKIADFRGDSKWITGQAARSRVHQLRSQVDAVLIGAGTARADDPELTSHGVGERDPKRLILSATGNLPASLKLLTKALAEWTILLTGETAGNGFPGQVWRLPSDIGGGLDLRAMLERVAVEKICSILVEGGRKVFSALIDAGLVDKYIIVTAPKLVGGGLSGYDHPQERPLSESLHLEIASVERIDEDIWIEAYPKK